MESKPKKAYINYLKGKGKLEYALLPFDDEDNDIWEKIKKMNKTITSDKNNKK